MTNGTEAAPIDHKVERLTFFSDAVFAIAITLLIIEIEVPHLHGNDPAAAGHALRDLLPHFFGFALSFIVIGLFWLSHHRALGMMSHEDRRLYWPNLLLLMSIAFMPFATAFLSANFGQTVPTLFYNLTLMVVAALNWRVIWIATAQDSSAASAEQRKDLRSRPPVVIVAAAIACLLTLLTPHFSQLALLIIPISRLLPTRRPSAAPLEAS